MPRRGLPFEIATLSRTRAATSRALRRHNYGGLRELRDDCYGGGSPSRRLPTWWGQPSGSSIPEMPSIAIQRARRNVVITEKRRLPDSKSGRKKASPTPTQLSQTVLGGASSSCEGVTSLALAYRIVHPGHGILELEGCRAGLRAMLV